MRISLLLLFLSFSNIILAQKTPITGSKVDGNIYPVLQEKFHHYDLYQIDLEAIDRLVKAGGDAFTLDLELGKEYQWSLEMFPYDMRGPDYRVVIATENGQEVLPPSPNMTYRGYAAGRQGGKVGLTITDRHFAGTVKEGQQFYFIEPLHYLIKDAPADWIIVYEEQDVIPIEGLQCGADELKEKMEEYDHDHEGHDHDHEHEHGQESVVGQCYELDLAIASDWLMYLDYNQSVPQVEAHNITVMNNVGTNWDDEFLDEIVFTIVTQFVSTCNTCDPWSATTNSGQLLGSFRAWGNGGGFGVPFGLGQLWTDRDLDFNVVGVAYLSGVCTGNRYHLLQDYTSNQNFLRVMASHEIGHNFSATHDQDGTPFIMAPVLNNTNDWSPASENSINSFISFLANQGGCFSNCPTSEPPVPEFSANPTQGCVPLTVQFTDQSTGEIDSWAWTFPGGTPATSTEQNPTVTYTSGGFFDVTLTVTNSAGSETLTKPTYIIANDGPVPAFDYNILDSDVYFTNNTSGGLTYFWEFGDGQTSTEVNPIHQYLQDGLYVVNLYATNSCGTTSIQQVIEVVTPPQPNFTADPTFGCNPLTVNFQDQSSPNTQFWAWTFPGGNPATSNEQNPTVVYDAPGTYSVTLQAINTTGSNSITITDYITVSPSPVPGFDFTITGNTVDFNNTSTNATSYEWDFGDMNSSTEENPSHTYANGGTYEVSLTAISDCGEVTTSQTIEIQAAPIAGFIADTTSGCTPLTVQFSDQSTNADSWDWTFEGGNPASSTEQNPTVTYDNPGTFNVSLTVSNAIGEDMTTEENYITVNTTPTADFSSTTNGLQVDFTNNSTNADSYEWDFGDTNSSSETNPSHTYAADGTYEVMLTATNECGSVTTSQSITITTPPTAGFNADIMSGCTPLTVQFSDQSSANATAWNWTFEGGNPASSTEQNPSVTYNNPGTFNVSLTVSNAAGEDVTTQEDYITVNTTPTASFSSTTNGLQVDFTNNSTNADSYEWDFGDSNSSSETNPTHTYAADGTYEVTLTATNECGSVTTSQSITITTLPTAGFNADIMSGCTPLTVQFSDQSSANATAWNWTFEGGNPASSTQQNPSVTYNNPGTFNVSLTVSNAAGEDIAPQEDYITVNTIPTANFSSTTNGLQVDFTNNSTNADSYEWDFGDNNSSTQTNPSHTYAADGTYEVTLTATNECGSVTTSQSITITTLPTAGFSADITSGCAPITVQFSDQSSANATAWNWTFEGGNPASSTEQNPSVTYNNPGTFNVSLTVSNAAGEDIATQEDYITVNTTPTVDFSSSVNGTQVDFTNTSTNATSYEWDFGDNNSSTQTNPTHTYANDGVYEVTLTATNECGSVTTTQSVTIVTPPTASFVLSNSVGCIPLSVEMIDQSSDNATAWAWSFPGGNPSSSTEQNPVVVYETPGLYDVFLTVSNAAGSSSVEQLEGVTVFGPPTAAFSTQIDGATATFTNNSLNGNSYAWNFGDGNTSNLPNPTHTYSSDGTYTVSLTVTNDCGTHTTSQEINIGTLPTAGFGADLTSGCAPLTVQFSDQSSANATSWNWTFEGGNPASSAEQNPLVTFPNSGTFTVTLTVSNASGSNTATQTDYITVNSVPSVDFTVSTNGLSANFTNTSTNADTYSWSFGDGNTSSESNPNHDYADDGTYTVTLNATNACGTVTTSQEVTITTVPSAGFSADIMSGCAPLTVQFSDQSSANATSWSWTFEGGNPASSTAQNPSVVYDSPGVYAVSLEVSNAAGSNTNTQSSYITVNTVPTAEFSLSGAGAAIALTNTSTNASSYSWDFGDGMGSEETNPTHTYATDGVYTVTLIASNSCGSTEISENFTAVTPPTAGFSADQTSGCAPLNVQFTDQSSTNTTSWAWTFEGGNPVSSNEQNPMVSYTTPGTYAVSLVATNAAGENTAILSNYITVNDVPNASFTSSTAGTNVNFTNTSTGASTYSWNFGDGNTSDDTNPSHDFEEDGNYMVTLTATNDCGSVTSTETIEIVTTPLAGFSADVTTGCASLTVQFNDQSSDNTTSWDWSFPGGTPSSSDEENPVVVYNTPGNYNVTLVATTSAGSNTYTQNQFIQVLTVPSVDFSTSIDGANVNFLNGSTGATTYLWEFGDGMTSEEANPSYTFPGDGDYLVTLTATNSCGSVSTQQMLSIASAPVAAFTSDVTIGCGPLSVQFTDLSSGNVASRQWTFIGGNPGTSAEANPQVNYLIPGTYSVILEVTNAVGTDTETITEYIVVEDTPMPDFNPIVTGATAIFSNQSSQGGTYLWEFGDGETSEEESPLHIYEADGTYTVTLTQTNSCGTVSTSQQILVVTPPTALFSASNTNGCVDLTVEFSNNSTDNADTFNWSFPGGMPSTSTEENPTVVYNTAGTYDVMLIVSNAAGMDTLEEISLVVANDIPATNFNQNTNGTEVSFTNASANADSYEWDFGDGSATSNLENPIHSYPGAGDYIVTLTATNSCGSSSFSQTVSITGVAPTAGFSATPLMGCVPMTVNFTDASSGSPTGWAWDFPGGNPTSSTEQNPSIVYDQPGTYEVSLTVTNSFGENTLTQTNYIEVGTVPSVDFDYEDTGNGATYDFTNNSVNGTSYFWEFGDGGTSEEVNPTYTYETPGEYTVTLQVTNDCGTVTTEQVIVIIFTSTEDLAGINTIQLYPNPNTGAFTLFIEGDQATILQFTLFNVLGQSIYSEPLSFNGGVFRRHFDFQKLAAGSYIVQLRSGDTIWYEKVIVE